MATYLSVNTAAELLCFIAALLCLYKDEDPVWRVLILFLFATCVVEFSGLYIRKTLHQSNFMLYNVFLIAECFVQSFFLYHLLKGYRNMRQLLIIWLLLFTMCFIMELYKNHFANFAFQTSAIMSVVLVLACVLFYYYMLKDEQFRQLSTYAPFWWVGGTLCFYFASTACNIFFSYLLHDKTPLVIRSVRYIIFNILNLVLYLNWSYAFLCRYRQRISSSLSK